MQYRTSCTKQGIARVALVLAGAMAAAGAGHAQTASGTLDQRFWLQVGAYHPSIDSEVRYDRTTGGLGTTIDFERDLGLKKRKTVPNVLFGVRLDERWRAEFEHFALKRRGVEVIGTTLEFGESTYAVGVGVETEFSTRVYRASLGYSLLRTPAAEFGAVVGLHATDFKLFLEGQALLPGGLTELRREKVDKLVPLPTIGVYGAYALSPSWVAAGRADLLSLRSKGYKGSLLNLQASLAYRVTPNFAIGGGYRYDDYRLRASKSDWTGRVEHKFSGPQVFLDAGF